MLGHGSTRHVMDHGSRRAQVEWLRQLLAAAGDRKLILSPTTSRFRCWTVRAQSSWPSWDSFSIGGGCSPGTGVTNTAASCTTAV